MTCCSVTKSCQILCDPVDSSIPGFDVLHYLLDIAQTHVHYVNDAIQPSHPLLPSSPSPFPASGSFPVSQLPCIRWPNDWSFSFSINPSNEYSGLISLRIDCFDLLAVQGVLKSLLQHHSSLTLYIFLWSSSHIRT